MPAALDLHAGRRTYRARGGVRHYLAERPGSVSTSISAIFVAPTLEVRE
jgi:hypothetical protein